MFQPSKLALALAASASMGFCLSGTTHAQEQVERIEITATQRVSAQTTPAAVTNLATSEQLPGMRIDAAELLGGIAGVQSDSRANYAQDTRITLRGFGARSAFGVRGVLLRLDGVPLSMPDGQAQTSSILLDEPDNVQVIRGPLAAIYGNAAGGVIHWRSRSPRTTATQVDLMAGGNDAQRAFVQHDWVNEDKALRLAGATFTTDGPRPHNRAERHQVAARWYQDLDENTRVVVRLDNNNAPFLQDPSSLTPAAWREDPTQTVGRAFTFNTRKRIHHQQASVTVEHETQSQAADISAWRGWRDVEQYLPFPGSDLNGDGAVIDLRRDFTGVDANYHLRLPALPQWQLSTGVQLAEQNDRRYGYVNNFGERGEVRRNDDGEVSTQSAYALLQWQPLSAWQMMSGVRYNAVDFAVDDYFIIPENPDDSGSASMQQLSWMLGANYAVSEQWSVFVSRGNGFETPTLTELAYRNDGTGLNTQLGPSTNQQWEVGSKWRSDTLEAAITWFHIATANEIVVDQSNDGRTTYTNAEQTQREGLELSFAADLSRTWSTRASATYTDAKYSNGARLPGVARQQAYWQLRWQPGADTQVQLVGDYRGEVAANDGNTVFAPAHTLWHVAVQTQWLWQDLKLQPWLKVHNLTDRDYVGSVVVNQGSGRAFEPGIGREVQAGLRFNYRW
ncbi:TonB-dependent receptor [Pseudidiomarina sp. 1APP75-27a]|uniref:TonB-dependent receptor family protein n=1 Tax=Pseudidiomarina terrestris TaxID=2820060 RepID=UPI002B05CCCE|nr:TonB-dependent receptor [Pseudidiomarina sp. 1APP75-27a]MEA3589085.1 TonB-dependent receptor [Pseudidiomarina sp. 1APP75-27a]